jgi:ribosomal protein L16/L10AE
VGFYYVKIRRLLKLILKRRKKFNKFKKRKVWVFLKPNQPISKKSKNSRMGKGKGSFLRWVTRLPRGFILMEFKGLKYQRLIKLNKEVTKIFGTITCLININKVI